MGFPTFLAKKVVFAIVTILIIMTLNFAIFRLMPGDPIAMLADQIRLRPEQVARLYELFGLDKPLWEQYISYMSQTLQGFLGYSYYTQHPVTQDIMDRLPNTLLLVGVSTIVSIVIGMVVGIVAAARRGQCRRHWRDQLRFPRQLRAHVLARAAAVADIRGKLAVVPAQGDHECARSD